MNNPKTTLLGILSIAGALIGAAISFLKGGAPDLASTFTAITAGIGLIAAKDAPQPAAR